MSELPGENARSAERAARVQSLLRKRREERFSKPPTWRGAINRAAIAAAVFGVLVVVLFARGVVQGALLAGFMFLLYIPLGYATDLMIYRFRQRRQQ